VSAQERQAQVAQNLAAVRERIAAAALACGRDPSSVTLIAVTKTYPASDVAVLADLGVRDIGENRDQEAEPKAAAMEAAGVEVRWHYIGQLQRNKARSVARYAYLVHSVDRLPLVDALDRARTELGAAGGVPPLDVLVQVSLEDVPGRGGVSVGEAPALADAVAATRGLRLAGVMAVAPLGVKPAPAFERLAAVAQRLTSQYPQATIISAGMSGDLEEAIAAGATHVRIGSALLGARSVLG
jgi:pyridoxal phosphate enzyme (YggS family)